MSLGVDDFVNQMINDWVFDVDQVLIVFVVCKFRKLIVFLFIVWRVRLSEAVDNYIKIKFFDDVYVICGIDNVGIGFNVQLFQIFNIG